MQQNHPFMTSHSLQALRCLIQQSLVVLITLLLTLAVNSAVIIPVAAYASGSVPPVNFFEEEEKRCQVTQSRVQQGVAYQKRIRDQEQIAESNQAQAILGEERLIIRYQTFLPGPLLTRTVRGPPVL